MLQGLINSQPLLGIESQSLGQEVDGLLARMGEESGERTTFADGEGADIITRTSGRDGVELVQARGT
jgi:hypothetical protein